MKILFISFLSFILLGCNSSTDQNQATASTAEKQQSDKRVSTLKTAEHNDASLQTNTKHGIKKRKKELRYLYFANGGTIAYFDDGTVSGCARCDFCRSNIVHMFNDEPYKTYVVEKDGSLLINGSEKEYPTYDSTIQHGWALIDYKWYIKPPQY